MLSTTILYLLCTIMASAIETYSLLLFDENENVIISKALNALDISTIDYKNDSEIERLISVIVACDCIFSGPFQLSEGQKSIAEGRLGKILDQIPETRLLNEFPRAIQFRSMVEKVYDGLHNSNPTMFISKMMEDN